MDRVNSNLGKPQFRLMLNYDGHDDLSVFHTLSSGRTFDRPMTKHERLVIGICSTEPTSALTLSSRSLSRTEAHRAFQCFLKLVGRKANRPDRPLIYCAALASSTGGDAGYHAHILLWEFLPKPVIAGIARRLGFGRPEFVTVGKLEGQERFTRTAYNLRQLTPAFGSTTHERHQPRPKHAKEILYPEDKTLAAERPELLSAIRDAQSKAVSDLELVSRSPCFNSYSGRAKRYRQ